MKSNIIQLGCTFTPEKYPDNKTAHKAFRFVLENLKLTQIRFAIRWNQVSKKHKDIDFSYYLPFFEIMEDFAEIELCLNIGPIKTTDWPEAHLPAYLLQETPYLPQWPRELQTDDLLYAKSQQYLDDLCYYLKHNLSSKILGKIYTIQLNNEGYNPFGDIKIVTSVEAEIEFCKTALRYFPEAKILFNSAGKLQIRKILTTIKKLDHPSILGIDYYYHTPINDYPLIKNINQLDLPIPWIPSFKKIHKTLEKYSSKLEFSEVQMEKWGHIEYPGYSKKALEKTIQTLLKYQPKHQQKLLFRLWGVELLAHKFITKQQTQEHEELVKFIRDFNKTF